MPSLTPEARSVLNELQAGKSLTNTPLASSIKQHREDNTKTMNALQALRLGRSPVYGPEPRVILLPSSLLPPL